MKMARPPSAATAASTMTTDPLDVVFAGRPPAELTAALSAVPTTASPPPRRRVAIVATTHTKNTSKPLEPPLFFETQHPHQPHKHKQVTLLSFAEDNPPRLS
eukprot:m.27076 g.27076  ORF g.27076 m.27076 type:complete len:102 (+) comp8447_c0_seq1:1570-1875(+)